MKSGIALVLAALSVPASAHANDRPPLPTERQQSEGREVLATFGTCMADAKPDIARRFVLADAVDLATPEWNGLVDSRCMLLHKGTLRMQPFLFRGALAERLVDKRVPVDALGAIEAIPPINATVPGLTLTAETDTFLLRLGECIVRANPEGARAMLRTSARSDAEKEAMAALSAPIASCVPQGSKVALSRANLRAGVAIMYYRLAQIADERRSAPDA